MRDMSDIIVENEEVGIVIEDGDRLGIPVPKESRYDGGKYDRK
jgi:hypothetical protein